MKNIVYGVLHKRKRRGRSFGPLKPALTESQISLFDLNTAIAFNGNSAIVSKASAVALNTAFETSFASNASLELNTDFTSNASLLVFELDTVFVPFVSFEMNTAFVSFASSKNLGNFGTFFELNTADV